MMQVIQPKHKCKFVSVLTSNTNNDVSFYKQCSICNKIKYSWFRNMLYVKGYYLRKELTKLWNDN